MDRLSQLADELTSVLDELHHEAAAHGQRPLMAPLAWLDEANSWLRVELRRTQTGASEEQVPFTYIPVALRK